MDELSAIEDLVGNEYIMNKVEANALIQGIHRPPHLPDFKTIVMINVEQYLSDQIPSI